MLYFKTVSYLIRSWTFLILYSRKCRAWKQSLFILFLTALMGCGRYQDISSRPSPLEADTLQSGDLTLSITYSSPRVRARKIWDGVVPFEKIWRTGANEATVFETNRDLIIENKSLPKGKYSIFSIPTNENWIIIFNKEWDQWGAYGYNERKDQLRISIKPSNNLSHQEEMTFKVDTSTIQFRWENLGYNLSYALY